MRKLAWAARGISAVSGAVLLGALVAPSAAAGGMDHDPKHDKRKCAPVSRDIAAAGPDYGALSSTVFRLATDRQGHAFLNDSRNAGVWINLGILRNAPECVVDTAVTATESGVVRINLLAKDGVIHYAQCAATPVPFTPENLPVQCGNGFSPVPGTPV